jgi:hypothetical protein
LKPLAYQLVHIFGEHEVFADAQVGAFATIFLFVAADLWGSEVVAIFGSSLGLDPVPGEDIVFAFDVLGGDLEAVKEEPGAARIELSGAEAVEDLGEGELDGAAVFEDGELERLISGLAFLSGVTVHTRVEVAKLLAAQGRRTALVAVGHNVTTDQIHEAPPPPAFQVNS